MANMVFENHVREVTKPTDEVREYEETGQVTITLTGTLNKDLWIEHSGEGVLKVEVHRG